MTHLHCVSVEMSGWNTAVHLLSKKTKTSTRNKRYKDGDDAKMLTVQYKGIK